MVFLLGKPGVELLGYMQMKEGPVKQLPPISEVGTFVVCCHYIITLVSWKVIFPLSFTVCELHITCNSYIHLPRKCSILAL